jgi:hypothetical protein
MKAFRDELLELLVDNVGEFIEVSPLVDKYCGQGSTFDDGDETKIRCRQAINLHLRELKDLGWINLTPQNGLSTAHSMNHDIGKRQFSLDYAINARMTTKGEIEYKKSKQEQAPTNTQNIGVNYGIASQSSDLRDLQAAFQPITTPHTVQNIATPKQGIMTSIGKWILDNIIGVIIAGLILGFIIYKLGWS